VRESSFRKMQIVEEDSEDDGAGTVAKSPKQGDPPAAFRKMQIVEEDSEDEGAGTVAKSPKQGDPPAAFRKMQIVEEDSEDEGAGAVANAPNPANPPAPPVTRGLEQVQILDDHPDPIVGNELSDLD